MTVFSQIDPYSSRCIHQKTALSRRKHGFESCTGCHQNLIISMSYRCFYPTPATGKTYLKIVPDFIWEKGLNTLIILSFDNIRDAKFFELMI